MVSTPHLGPALKEQAHRFGPFRLIPSQRLLLESEHQVRIGARALDILILLIERAGSVVTKAELIAHVWPDTVVEEINLRVSVAALRRALGDDEADHRYIANVVGRGYSFVASVTRDTLRPTQVGSTSNAPRRIDLPVQGTRMVGRAADVNVLTELLLSRRLVTIVGTGGVGKSTLALEVGCQLIARYTDGACFVELGAISDSCRVPHSLATAIGLTVSVNHPVGDLVGFLRDKHMLIVLDNCEHVIASAAALIETLLKGAHRVQILATSRERLSIEGEWYYRLSPLKVPMESSRMTALLARDFTAIQLFMERAVSNTPSFALSDANARIVAHICQRLDGIPLALELAAARVNLLGIRELAARLDDQFVLANERRSAVPRHQTLQGTLDWSYRLLDPVEQLILRRLSAFKGPFTLDSAVDLAARQGLDAEAVLDGVMALADKSLITIDTGELAIRYHLLHTTRTYAFERLSKTDEVADICRWHAECIAKFFRRAEADWGGTSRSTWVTKYSYAIDDVRSALDWAFSPSGDAALGAALTVASVPFGYQLALIEEFRDRVKHALAHISNMPVPQAVFKSRLTSALKMISRYTQKVECAGEFSHLSAIETSETVDIAKYKIGPILQKTICRIEDGNYREAVGTAKTLGTVAKEIDDPLATLIADRVLAQAQHFNGEFSAARALAERVLKHPAKVVPLAYAPMQVDLRVSMRILLSRTLWLQGFPDQAVHVANECLDHAVSDSPFARCQALALAACPVAFWRGDIDAARRVVATLLTEADRYRLGHWRSYGECYERLIFAYDRKGEANGDSTAPPPVIHSKGLIRDTLATIDPDVLGAEFPQVLLPGVSGWCTAEILRIEGERILKERGPDAESQAESIFLRSIETADAQNALAWRLRTSISLATLWHSQQRTAEACDMIGSVYSQFSEGHETRDLRRASILMQGLTDVTDSLVQRPYKLHKV
jgi:predicted ATPase/DNA-binding winged helix-turn-helix (wHTH) protein